MVKMGIEVDEYERPINYFIRNLQGLTNVILYVSNTYERPLTTAVMVQGFDIPLDADAGFAGAASRARRILDDAGIARRLEGGEERLGIARAAEALDDLRDHGDGLAVRVAVSRDAARAFRCPGLRAVEVGVVAFDRRVLDESVGDDGSLADEIRQRGNGSLDGADGHVAVLLRGLGW